MTGKVGGPRTQERTPPAATKGVGTSVLQLQGAGSHPSRTEPRTDFPKASRNQPGPTLKCGRDPSVEPGPQPEVPPRGGGLWTQGFSDRASRCHPAPTRALSPSLQGQHGGRGRGLNSVLARGGGSAWVPGGPALAPLAQAEGRATGGVEKPNSEVTLALGRCGDPRWSPHCPRPPWSRRGLLPDGMAVRTWAKPRPPGAQDGVQMGLVRCPAAGPLQLRGQGRTQTAGRLLVDARRRLRAGRAAG